MQDIELMCEFSSHKLIFRFFKTIPFYKGSLPAFSNMSSNMGFDFGNMSEGGI